MNNTQISQQLGCAKRTVEDLIRRIRHCFDWISKKDLIELANTNHFIEQAEKNGINPLLGISKKGENHCANFNAEGR